MLEYKQRFPGPISPSFYQPKPSMRRMEISDCLAEGMNHSEIADALGISKSAVRVYIKRYAL